MFITQNNGFAKLPPKNIKLLINILEISPENNSLLSTPSFYYISLINGTNP